MRSLRNRNYEKSITNFRISRFTCFCGAVQGGHCGYRAGTGSYSSNHLAFYDANGTYLVLDGVQGIATMTYPDQTLLTFPYSQTVSGLSVTGSWSGVDESGYLYTATVQ